MSERQLDLFAAGGVAPAREPPPATSRTQLPSAMGDEALVAAIPDAGLRDAPALAEEAGRRRLAAAIPALAALCGRFAGYGAERLIPEQAAALRALGAIGGREAGRSLRDLVAGGAIEGPALAMAAEAATALDTVLPARHIAILLNHADPAVRCAACRCAPPAPELVPALLARLDDLDRAVARAAACALGRAGRPEARAALLALLQSDPAEDVIDAMAAVADETGLVLLARIARTMPGLAPSALDALEANDHPRARTLLAQLRGETSGRVSRSPAP
jgi:HEAT repeat protein